MMVSKTPQLRSRPGTPEDIAPESGRETERVLFLPDASELADTIRTRDWGATPLGPASDWGPCLRATVDLITTSRFPMIAYWGDEFTAIYNEGLLPMIGSKHPAALGTPAASVFAEIWSELGPLLEAVLHEGQSIVAENLFLPLVRANSESPQECYFTFTYSPLVEDTKTRGVLCVVVESTQLVIEDRRLRLLSALHEAGSAQTVAESCAHIAKELEKCVEDVPVAAIYLKDPACPDVVTLAAGVHAADALPERWHSDWPSSLEKATALEVPDLPASARGVIALPIQRASAGADQTIGFLLLGLSKLLPPSPSYSRFHELLAANVSRCLNDAAAREQQQRRIDQLQYQDQIKSTSLAEAQRRVSFHRQLMQAPFAVAFLRGPQHIIELANPAILRAWAVGADVVGLPLIAALPALEGQPFLGYLDEVYQTGQARVGRAELARLPTGPDGALAERYFDFIYSPLAHEDGMADGVMVSAFDVTDAVAANSSAEEARTRAEQAEERAREILTFQERFVAILGHDLRGPLGAIEMANGILMQEAERDENKLATRVLRRSASSTRRMARMVDQLLDLSMCRLGGGLPVVQTRVDLPTVLQSIVAEVRTVHQEREVVLSCDAIVGRWDRDRLEQVFANLLGNAIHHGRVDEPITITCRRVDDDVRVEVLNQGTAIPDDIQQSLFDAFRRGERDSRDSNTSGLGLGLYISQQIAKAHGGVIELRSSEAHGTAFTLVLPFTSEPTPKELSR